MANLGILFALAAGIGFYKGSLSTGRRNLFTIKALNEHECPKQNFAKQFAKYGLPKRDVILRYNDFEICYDNRNRQPNWVLECLNKEKVHPKRPSKRPKVDHHYHSDDRIPTFFQSTERDYGEQYWKGRLASEENYAFSQKNINDTYAFSNISPQKLLFNVAPWECLEEYVRHKTSFYKNVYVFTGPLFQSRKGRRMEYHVTECNHVAVPTDFFKIIIGELDGGCLHVGSYILPNERLPKDKDLNEFRVELEEVEKRAGFQLFRDKPFSGPLIEEGESSHHSGMIEDWKVLLEDEEKEKMKKCPRTFAHE